MGLVEAILRHGKPPIGGASLLLPLSYPTEKEERHRTHKEQKTDKSLSRDVQEKRDQSTSLISMLLEARRLRHDPLPSLSYIVR